MSNNFLKRGEGKNTGDIKKYDFFSYFRKHTQYEKLNRKSYDAFISELLLRYSEAIVKENLELKFGVLGFIRIQARDLHFFNKNGELAKSLKPDWKKTWESWMNKYPELSKDEIVEIKNKKLIYFENEHTNGEFYLHLWDNTTALVKFKSFYKFKAARKYCRMINKEVRKEPRTVFYYG
jgi:hypothetical protein